MIWNRLFFIIIIRSIKVRCHVTAFFGNKGINILHVDVNSCTMSIRSGTVVLFISLTF